MSKIIFFFFINGHLQLLRVSSGGSILCSASEEMLSDVVLEKGHQKSTQAEFLRDDGLAFPQRDALGYRLKEMPAFSVVVSCWCVIMVDVLQTRHDRAGKASGSLSDDYSTKTSDAHYPSAPSAR